MYNQSTTLELTDAQRQQVAAWERSELMFRWALFNGYGATWGGFKTPYSNGTYSRTKEVSDLIQKHQATAISGLCMTCGGAETLRIIPPRNSAGAWSVRCACGFSATFFDLLDPETGYDDAAEFAAESAINAPPVDDFLYKSDLVGSIRLPFKIDPDATCPKWTAFINQIQPNCLFTRDLIQEYFGYCLTTDTSLDACLILWGKGANGKTVLLRVLEEVLGPSNVSRLPLAMFTATRNPDLAGLDGKRVNIAEEVEDYRRFSEGVLKDVISGGTIPVKRRGEKETFNMTPVAKLIFASNDLPKINDGSDGFWRRLLLVPFNVQFDRKTANPELRKPSYWADERAGILNWMIAGLERLRARGNFFEPPQCEDLKADYRERQTNPGPAEFLKANYCLAAGGSVVSAELYAHYCKDAVSNPVSPVLFGTAVQSVFPGVRSERCRVDGKQVRVWAGLALSHPVSHRKHL